MYTTYKSGGYTSPSTSRSNSYTSPRTSSPRTTVKVYPSSPRYTKPTLHVTNGSHTTIIHNSTTIHNSCCYNQPYYPSYPVNNGRGFDSTALWLILAVVAILAVVLFYIKHPRVWWR